MKCFAIRMRKMSREHETSNLNLARNCDQYMEMYTENKIMILHLVISENPSKKEKKKNTYILMKKNQVKLKYSALLFAILWILHWV